MKQQGISDADIKLVTYTNAIAAFGKSGQINEADFSGNAEIDQSHKFSGNTILRGGQQPRIDRTSIIIK
jgi:hypothetical protein